MSVSVSYQSKKCTSCGGRVEYLQDKKVWHCLYCGAEMEREESYDGLYTIKNVARQALVDVAYRRLDSAKRNIVECEKIDAKYVGTLLAKITNDMITAITPEATAPHELRNLLSNVKRNFQTLVQQQGSRPSEVELAFYEFLEGDADVLATLLLVFDSLGDSVRSDYMERQLQAEKIFSLETNTNLLTYAIKNDKIELIDTIVSNANNLNLEDAFFAILLQYPTGEQKVKNVSRLLEEDGFHLEDAVAIENYLKQSTDDTQTKAEILAIIISQGVTPRMEVLIQTVFQPGEVSDFTPLLLVLLEQQLTDVQRYQLVDFALTTPSLEKSKAILENLLQAEQYVVISPQHLLVVLNKEERPAQQRMELLEILLEFQREERTILVAAQEYLLRGQGDSQQRMMALDLLFSHIEDLPTTTVEEYILQTTVDGSDKPKVVEMLWALDLNVSLYRNTLSRYLKQSQDPQEIRIKIIDILMACGLTLSGEDLTEMVLSSTISTQHKINITRKMRQANVVLSDQTASKYLEQFGRDEFNATLFSLLYSGTEAISSVALEHYLLYAEDFSPQRIQNSQQMISRQPPSQGMCRIIHGENTIECNLLQAYLLITPDDTDTAQQIVDMLKQASFSANDRITLHPGTTLRFKKYLADYKEQLAPVSLSIAERERMFSFF